MTDPITLVIVDDHAVVRGGVRAFLNAQADMRVVAEGDDGAAAVALAAEHAPDVVVIDLLMPGMDGVEATRRIKATSPRTQVVVLTSYHDDEHVFPALRAGAISYLLKSLKMDDLAQAIRRAARGEATLDPGVASRVIREMQAPGAGKPNPFTELTERELDVLKLIAAGATNAEIAERLVLSPYTVKGHVSNILSKLQLADRTQAAILAWREGVVRRGSQPD